MNPQSLVDELVPTLPWALLSCSLGTIVALVCGALYVQRLRVPPVLAALGPGLPALVALMVAWGATTGADAVSRHAVAVAVGHRLLAAMFVALPAVFVVMLGAGAAALRPPRRRIEAALGALLVVAVVTATFAGGRALDDTTLGTFRALVYAGFGLFAALAMFAGDAEEGAGPEAATAAGVAFALVVAAGENGVRALAELQALAGLEGVAPELRAEVYRQFLAEVIEPQRAWSWGSFGGAASVALLGASTLRLAPSPRRLVPGVLALAWLLVAALLLTAGAPSAEAFAGAVAEPAVAHDPAGENSIRTR